MEREHLISCPTCKQALLERTSKAGKPYFICDDCKVQVFVRGKKGIARLKGELGVSSSPTLALSEELKLKVDASKRQLRLVQDKEGLLSELWQSEEQSGIIRQIKMYKEELKRIQL